VPPTCTGPNRRKQIEAGTFGAKEDRHFAASCQAVPAYLTDNHVIGCSPNSGECNQPREGSFAIHRGHSASAIYLMVAAYPQAGAFPAEKPSTSAENSEKEPRTSETCWLSRAMLRQDTPAAALHATVGSNTLRARKRHSVKERISGNAKISAPEVFRVGRARHF
jgi:hypothetical protein